MKSVSKVDAMTKAEVLHSVTYKYAPHKQLKNTPCKGVLSIQAGCLKSSEEGRISWVQVPCPSSANISSILRDYLRMQKIEGEMTKKNVISLIVPGCAGNTAPLEVMNK